jgi:Ca-activated chloride channel family protein
MRRVAVVLALAAGLAAASLVHALVVDDSPMAGFWLTPDQQGRRLFGKGDYAAAAERFQDPAWKGMACYRNKAFDQAASQFSRVDTAAGAFNLGNALTHAGHLEQALAAYEDALRREPANVAARENRDLVRSLIRNRKPGEEEQQAKKGRPPTFNPDDVKMDDKGKQGQQGEVDQAELTAEQIQELWMRRLQTTPSDFLRLKFAAQAEEAGKAPPRNAAGGRS